MNDNGSVKAASLFYEGLVKLDLRLPQETVANLVRYALELVKWNRKVNLVAKNTSLEDIVEKHFLDSLTLLPVLESNSLGREMLLDIGSGAGFPGLVVKAACPLQPVTLLEPRQRRVVFLNHIIRTLCLSGIEVIQHRTDEQDALPHDRYGIITGRAIADVSSFLNMINDLSASGTLVVCMQGASGLEQWEQEKDNRLFLPLQLEQVRLPFSRAQRFILLFKKI